MKTYRWEPRKNEELKAKRGVSFEQVVLRLGAAELLDILEHPNQKRYPGQRIFVVELEGYAFVVPFVESGEEVFLKSIIPSRRATRKYLDKGDTDENET